MSNNYVHIKKAPVEYVTSDGVVLKTHLVPINNVNISNAFDIPYVRGIVGYFNAMISRFMYFAHYNEFREARKYPKAQSHIFLPADQLSPMIDRCESQCYNIKDQLEYLFDLDISRSAASKFKLSERVIEFLYIFNYDQLYEFMNKYNITNSEDQYRLRQLYEFKVVRPSDSNMTREQKEDFYSYMKKGRHKDFHHFLNTNNVSIQARIQKIESHINLLSDKQQGQLNRIKTYLKQGFKRLSNTLHWKLLELQQFITGMLKLDQITASKSNQEDSNTTNHVINRNKTEGEQEKTAVVAAVHLKDPEEPSIQDIVQVTTYWNIMARGRKMEFFQTLTEATIKSMITLVKLYGKDKVLNTIENTGRLQLNSTLKLSSLLKDGNQPDNRFNKIHRHDHLDTRFTEDEVHEFKEKRYSFILRSNPISMDNIPSFHSTAEAKLWFKEHVNQM